MAKGYWIGRVDVSDPEGYKAYVAANAEPFRKYGARFLVRGGTSETVEGSSRSRNVVLEFADLATALACYRSPEYAAAIRLRDGRAVADLIAVEGVDAPPAGQSGGASAKGYWVARVDVSDPEGYQAYVAADAAAFTKFGARFLVRGGRFETLEGASRSRNIMIEFADLAAARACYRSPEYQQAAALRRGKATFDLIIIEGYSGPQPADP
jgi:uncharacterized protein (DUF1330 family)